MARQNPFASKEVYGYETLHREIGYYVSRLEQYEKSLKFFDKALEKCPNDKRALIGRSKARTKLAHYKGALKDVNKALSLDPDDFEVRAVKAKNTYLRCEFEEGLVQNSRMILKRYKPDCFKIGVFECTDAIENSVGESSGKPLRDHFKIIRKLAWKGQLEAPYEHKRSQKKAQRVTMSKIVETEASKQKPIEPNRRKKGIFLRPDLEILESLHSFKSQKDNIPPYRQKFSYHPLQYHTSNLENYMAEKYLGPAYLDKAFLREIESQPGSNSPNKEGVKKIKRVAKDCLKVLAFKQEILRTRRPLYCLKYQESKATSSLKEKQRLEFERTQRQCKTDIEALLKKLMNAHKSHQLKLVLDLAHKIRNFCEAKSKQKLPDKAQYMMDVYKTVCHAFYDMYRLNSNQLPCSQKRRIYHVLGLPLSRPASADSVIDQFKDLVIDYKKKISELSLQLKSAKISEEICWYYHELSRYEFELNEYALSDVYAKKCIHEANEISNTKWAFNANMLLLKNSLAHHNRNDASNNLEAAKVCAHKLKDMKKVKYLKLCEDIINSVVFEDKFGAKQIERRQRAIVQLMADSKMKEEMTYLFKAMGALPASRRLLLMPGVKFEEHLGNAGKHVPKRTLSSMSQFQSMSSNLSEILDN